MFRLGPLDSIAPTANYATLGIITDASTPGANIPVLDFDPTTAESADWRVTVPSNYAGGGFTFSWKGGTSAANAGTLQLDFRVLKIADATTLTGDLGVDTQTAASVSDTPAATADQMNYSTTAALSHANAGSPAAGDELIIRATRNVATDTNTGDLRLASILATET